MKIRNIECFKVNLPFKKKFEISHKSREYSESVFVKVSLVNGEIGWGESLPRDYVTGETQESVIKALQEKYIPFVLKWDIKDFDMLVCKLKKLSTKRETNCALCAIELALLDAYGKYFKKSVSEIFGGVKKDKIHYSGIVSGDGLFKLLKIKFFGFKDIKLKVGFDDDMKRLKLIRGVFGKNVDIRVDANSAWDVKTSLEKIEEFKKFNVSAVEQPVKTLEELNKVASLSKIPIIADESLCTLSDAKKLKNVVFDIRISKCGGLLKSLEIYEYAKKNNIKCILGCQVGESEILTSAGRHFAFGVDDMLYLEGSYNHFLLKKDVTKQDLTLGRKGEAKAINGYGMGFEVDEEVLRNYIV